MSNFPEMPAKVLYAYQIFLTNHNITETSERVGVSRTTLYEWRKKYKWDEREQETLNQIINNVAEYKKKITEEQRKIIRAVIAKSIKNVTEGDLEAKTVHELIALLKYQLELEGERFDETKIEVNNTVSIAALHQEIMERRLKRELEAKKEELMNVKP